MTEERIVGATPPGERLFFADIMPPAPDRAAMSVRSAQFLSFLVRGGYKVDFAAAQEWPSPNPRNALARLGVNDLGIRSYDDAAEYVEVHAGSYDIAVLAWTQVAHRLLPIFRARSPRTFVIFDTHDVNHLREYRYARVTGNQRALRRAILFKQWETAAATEADCTIAITPVDARALLEVAPGARIRVATMAAPVLQAPLSRDGANMLFVGNLTSPPNYDAALWLAREVLPRVRAEVPQATLTLAGSDPADALGPAVAGQGIRVTGWVPDLAPLLASARVFVAALRFGSGVKGKVLQAIAAGLPVVATSIAAEGINILDGRDFLLAERPEDLAKAVVRVITDSDLGLSLARNAAGVIARDHSPEAIDAQFAGVLALRSATG